MAKDSNVLLAWLCGGFTCGVLDITAALVVYGYFGLKPMRLLQGVASGILGQNAFNGGAAAALLGLFCHFFIAFGASGIYVLASRSIDFLIEYGLMSGVLYGVAVHFFMQHIVLPLSAAAKRPFSLKMMTIGVVIHIFCVGIPIALSARRILRG